MQPTHNNPGVAHENGVIESAHGHLKAALRDALLIRTSADFADLKTYRAFVDELIARRNARIAKRIDSERPFLEPLPGSRTPGREQLTLRVTATSSFTVRKVFYSVPSRLIGDRLRIHLFDDLLDLFLGGTFLMTLSRGRASPDGRHGKVVDYRYLIHSLRRKPMALLGLVYRDQLFPRDAFRRTFERMRETLTDKAACKTMVGLLALAHDRACEAELAKILDEHLEVGPLPDLIALQARFGPDPAAVPIVEVRRSTLADYDRLVEGAAINETAIGEAA